MVPLTQHHPPLAKNKRHTIQPLYLSSNSQLRRQFHLDLDLFPDYCQRITSQQTPPPSPRSKPFYISTLTTHGLSFIGKDDKGERMETLEVKDRPWFVGVQFHPEYLSRVLERSRPYLGFLAASAGCLDEVTKRLKRRGLGECPT
jgi:Glutamine amidotransferase class-I